MSLSTLARRLRNYDQTFGGSSSREGVKRNEKTGFPALWKPANSKGRILHVPSCRDGVSGLAESEEPDASQTSRVRSIAVLSADSIDLTLSRGVAKEMIKKQRISAPVFLIE